MSKLPSARPPRVLLWDVETSLQLVALFQLAHNDWIDPSALVSERYVVCGSWKWLDKPTIHAVSVLDDAKRYKKDPHDDRHVIKVLHEVLSEADIIVAHNGDAFDTKFVETRVLYHEFAPLPAIPSIDTYKVAKSRFRFNSNKLDYLGKFLKVGRKTPTVPGLWMRVLQGDAAAVREMVAYNKQDVALLERVFLKLQPYATQLNRQLFGQTGCPRCGSTRVQSRGVARTVARSYQRFQCTDCGGWFRMLKAEPMPARTRVI